MGGKYHHGDLRGELVRVSLDLIAEQGLAAFDALQRRGIESRFLNFPDENHWVLKPANSLQWHAEVLGWMDRYLK